MTTPASPALDASNPIQRAVARGLEALDRPDLAVETGPSRRRFLRGAALAAAGAAVSTAGVTKVSAETARRRWGMVIDLAKCVGCKACLAACKAENQTPPNLSYNALLDAPAAGAANDRPTFMTRPCMHCIDPACLKVCPAEAIFRQEGSNLVLVDYDRCVGFRKCIDACPYGVPVFDEGANYDVHAGAPPAVPSPEYREYRARVADQPPIGRSRKCTYCMHLQDASGGYDRAAGRWPACAKTCTGHAIHFGDLADPAGELRALIASREAFRLHEEKGTDPSVYYLR